MEKSERKAEPPKTPIQESKKESRLESSSAKIDPNDSRILLDREKLTKIEVNMENSEDDIDFIGYGNLRVGNKKSTSPTSNIKRRFIKISPAKDLSKEMDRDGTLKTKCFTPLIYESEKKRTAPFSTAGKDSVPASARKKGIDYDEVDSCLTFSRC